MHTQLSKRKTNDGYPYLLPRREFTEKEIPSTEYLKRSSTASNCKCQVCCLQFVLKSTCKITSLTYRQDVIKHACTYISTFVQMLCYNFNLTF